MQDGILSIQSAVAYGHVGNSAAVFPLQRLGHEVWPVNTVLFSNHTGYGAWRGRVVDVAWVEEIITGLRERGVIPRCRAVLSGYLGDASLGAVVVRTVAEVRASRRDAIYACDPVMGDVEGGFFVRPGIPEFFIRQAVPAADIVTPNAFELAHLAGRPINGIEDALEAAELVRRMGPCIVVCTSMVFGAGDRLGVLAHSEEASWVVWTPMVPVTLSGTGDVFTALFLGRWLASGNLRDTLETAVSAMYALVAATHRLGSAELAIVAAQDDLVRPSRTFSAEALR
jgi:pyridoxine kinase